MPNLGRAAITNFPKWSEVRAEHRKALGPSQTDVADKMSVTKSRVSQIERGEVSPSTPPATSKPSAAQVEIAAVFGDNQ